ncbi:MAG TPA: glycosyltransferase family 39 protein [Terracidiphilus sp.]|nr:glycosyltransferase family 39 protein [Terracidiphilus sp.]
MNRMKAAAASQSSPARPRAVPTQTLVSIAFALLAAAILRLWMVHKFFEVNGDSLIYGGIAKNLLLHGRYALTLDHGETFATLIRLPGYPLFLAACFQIFGMENYAAASFVQIALELVGCLFLADFARRIAPSPMQTRAFHATLWLAALCPFTAVYAANPLTEGPTLFSIVLALWSAQLFRELPAWLPALSFTFAVTFAALLRPDGALVACALAPALLFAIRKTPPAQSRAVLRIAIVCALLAATPFALWTARNWSVFHVIQPLAPKSATDPGDPVSPGWDRWMKTWCLDFVSTYQIAWNVPGDVLDLSKLPGRAFDSPQQRAQTAALADTYNSNGYTITPELDAAFDRLARERIAAHPLRSDLWLPLGRVVDMALRPRVENLPIDLDWWIYAHHYAETRFSWAYAALNVFYLVLAIAGFCLRPRMAAWMLAYILLRSAMLFTVCPPEARYTLEWFPMLFALGGVALARVFTSRAKS